jgi:HEAT repeat protein
LVWNTFISSAAPELRAALAVGLLALLMTGLLTLQVLLLRARSARQLRTEAAVVARWRPLLQQAAADGDVAATLPALRGHERAVFLVLWNRMQDSLRGQAHDGLNRLAHRLRLRDLAQDWAQRGNGGQRVLALATLGHLRSAQDWDRLFALLDDTRPYVSLAAARALLQIDPERAVPWVLEQYLARVDWPVSRVGTLLREAGAEACGVPLAERLLFGVPQVQLRLLPLARVTEAPGPGSAIEAVLATASAPSVLAAALQQVHGPSSLERVRELTRHPDWQVRSYAARALGRTGVTADQQVLGGMLADRQWWVRYRAAQALLALPDVAYGDVVRLLAKLDDRYARDIVAQVRAERALDASMKAA